LGCRECRAEYRNELQEFLAREAAGFCPDCQRRRLTNPLRVFDCKVERCRKLLVDAPVLLDRICPACAAHFARVRGYLEQLSTEYVIDPHMVRGLDYYTRTTFEVITDRLGAQNAVGGGGRYDGLMKDLGGPDLPGIGFAMGMERLILLLQEQQEETRRNADLFVAVLGEEARQRAFPLVQELRSRGLAAEMDYGVASLKSQMRRADKFQVRFVAILGDDEVARGELQLRDMTDKTQVAVPLSEAAEILMLKMS
jgi:histidyl-tRNA synthetase